VSEEELLLKLEVLLKT